MALWEYPPCRPTDPTDPDTDNDGYLDSRETFPLGCGKNVTVSFWEYYVGQDTCDELNPGCPAQLLFEFTLEHNGGEVAHHITYPAEYFCSNDPSKPCRIHADCGGYPNECWSECHAETIAGHWLYLDNYNTYRFPSGWATTLLMRPGDYIDIYGIVSECRGSELDGHFPLECHGFQLRKTYDDLRSEILSQKASGCASCFTDHELGLRFLVQP